MTHRLHTLRGLLQRLRAREEDLLGIVKHANYRWTEHGHGLAQLPRDTSMGAGKGACTFDDLTFPATKDVQLRIWRDSGRERFVILPRRKWLAIFAPKLIYRCNIFADGEALIARGYYEYDWRLRVLALTIVNLTLLFGLLFAGRAVLDLGFGLVSPFPPMDYVMALAMALLTLGMVVLLFAVTDLITMGSQKAVRRFLQEIRIGTPRPARPPQAP